MNQHMLTPVNLLYGNPKVSAQVEMEQMIMYDNLRIFWGLEDFRLIIA